MKYKIKTGFTLIELLVVIAIVGILAAAVLVAINPGKRMAQARDARRKSDLSAIGRAIQIYMVDNNMHPPLCPNGTSGAAFCTITSATNFCTAGQPGCYANFTPYYQTQVRQDPKNVGTACDAAYPQIRGLMYCYRPNPAIACISGNTCTGFWLYACLEDSSAVIDSKFVWEDLTCTSKRDYVFKIDP